MMNLVAALALAATVQHMHSLEPHAAATDPGAYKVDTCAAASSCLLARVRGKVYCDCHVGIHFGASGGRRRVSCMHRG